MVEHLLPLNTLYPLLITTSSFFMGKYRELHRRIKKNGWTHIRTGKGHYIYEKDGKIVPVPYHGSKDIGKGLEQKIVKEMGLK